MIAEGEEHIDHEDSTGIAIDPTLHTWIFDVCALSAKHSLVSELAPEGNIYLSDLLVEPDSEGESTGSPMVLDETDEEMINSDEFPYFPTSNRVQVVNRSEQVEPADAFSEPVIGRLPYVMSASQDKHMYDGLLLDEERVIGIIVSLFLSAIFRPTL